MHGPVPLDDRYKQTLTQAFSTPTVVLAGQKKMQAVAAADLWPISSSRTCHKTHIVHSWLISNLVTPVTWLAEHAGPKCQANGIEIIGNWKHTNKNLTTKSIWPAGVELRAVMNLKTLDYGLNSSPG
jgi:hypothetical protein